MTTADPLPLGLLLPILLYAEVHYRFPFLPFSRYYRREPEVLADVPFRIDPDESLPLLILVKDAHRFPVHFETATVTITDSHENRKEREIIKDVFLDMPWWYEIVPLDMEGFAGECTINVVLRYRRGTRRKTCVNHNVRGSGHPPLSVYASSARLPGKQSGWHWGDLHCHTWVTEDFVEFGAPLDATREAARAAGLSFLGITDHSYDIDDLPGSWKETDPRLTKWHRIRSEIETLNGKGPPVLIPGEELSTENCRGKNVHTLILNHPEFIPGSGDGGEQWFSRQTEHRIRDLEGMLHPDALAIAAHPRSPFSRAQQLFLNRGIWEKDDFDAPGISGFEVLNGSVEPGFHDGLHHWIETLLKGRKTFIYAGNDAHGNFNRFRQIKTPNISIWDHQNHVLGKCRTGVRLSGPPSLPGLMSSLKSGKCVISNGPLITLTARSTTSSATLGESIFSPQINIDIEMESTPEFGELFEARVYWGDLEKGEERVVSEMSLKGTGFQGRQAVETGVGEGRGYLRGELTSRRGDGDRFFCYTNPIWVNP